MAAHDLAQAFEVDISVVENWIAQGCPVEVEEAEQWLVDNGLAGYEEDDPDDLIETRNKIAALVGFSSTKVGVHVLEPTFPPGPPWSKRAILDWFANRPAPAPKPDAPPSTKEERDRVKLEMERLQLQKEKGEVLSLEDVIAEMTRQHSLAVAKLKGLVNRLIDLLPPDTPPMIIDDFRNRARKVIDDACDDIATAFRGGVDDDLD